MAAVQIEWKAMTLQERLNVIQKVEANQSTTHVQMATEIGMPVATLDTIMRKKASLSMRVSKMSSKDIRLEWEII
jgi:hypothetical protein